jgi:hypothetical protein
MRFATLLLLTLLLSLACDWNGPAESANTLAGKPNPPSNSGSPLQVNRSPAEATSSGFTEAQFAEHVDQLKTRLPSTDFSIVIQPPFVVVGDESEQLVKQRAEDTVKWAVVRLKQDFFAKDPKEILDIWLFKDDSSYGKYTRLLFGESPTTPYGFYSSSHKALIMNIGTGGGTLVHEIVHPFIESNFPACPPWLNEGMGSLYEQCGDVDGHIHGFTNWRLPGLQRAIQAKQVPTFKALTAMNTNAFYNQDKGVNYAQARYLCYYLQEKGLLIKFYREFQAHQKEDPGGYKSLQKILREPRMDRFQDRWEKFVLGLKIE